MINYFHSEKILFNDKLYIVIRRIRESHNPITETWKKHLHADIVLRKDGWYFFCQEVTDIEWEDLT